MLSTELVYYITRILPGALTLGLFFFLLPARAKVLRLMAFIWLFILLRDALLPCGLWSLTRAVDIRFIQQPLSLWVLALSSVGLVVASHFLLGKLNDRRLWIKGKPPLAIMAGLGGGLTVACLPWIYRHLLAIPAPQPMHGMALILGIAAIAFLGNLLEEVIFRGHLQHYLYEQNIPHMKVVLLSGLAFGCAHIFLAYTVTSLGWPVLFFTLYEGLLCAYLRDRLGLLPAVLAHGLGIFIITTGWL